MLRKQFFLYYVAILVAHTVFWCAIKRYDIWEQLLNDKLQSTIEPNCLPTISHFSLSQLVIISLVIFGNIGINMNIFLRRRRTGWRGLQTSQYTSTFTSISTSITFSISRWMVLVLYLCSLLRYPLFQYSKLRLMIGINMLWNMMYCDKE